MKLRAKLASSIIRYSTRKRSVVSIDSGEYFFSASLRRISCSLLIRCPSILRAVPFA
jgi:hypothetical protein